MKKNPEVKAGASRATNRNLKSPFHGATKRDLRTLRGLAVYTELWKRSSIAGHGQLIGYAPEIQDGHTGLYVLKTLFEFENRAWKAMSRLANFDQICAAHSVEHMRRYDRDAYESHMLRQEVTELRNRVSTLETAR
ncbi:hypothetical protein [Leifsonia sp. Leaf264]|uniref:hypothetical protein n=1 Tax=Leifsonia sp. Leaf264 TaxID=1736314 RepID=UPI0006F6B943|nr:hypothetical protein [Leifsonia sp. Leaf264]KQO98467.1 hypothetical protein ASF30_10420 [Leifsonia sp. Leaf264]